MHPNILCKEQQELLPLIQQFKREFYLVGGTAIALQIGHRRSIDFDLFKLSNLNASKTLKKLDITKIPYTITRRVDGQINLIINSVKLTFFQYPYSIEAKLEFEKYVRMPDLITLAAMKAYALGYRSKWKDYVDLYFIIKDHYSVQDIADEATKIYGNHFAEKLFRQQLAFHKDIDYREEVDYLIPNPPKDSDIREKLIDIALCDVC